MKSNRRKFLKLAGMTGLSVTGFKITEGFAAMPDLNLSFSGQVIGHNIKNMKQKEENLSIIGQYGQWASSLTANKLPSMSFRKKEYSDLQKWQKTARKCTEERMSIPDIGNTPEVNVKKQYTYDGLQVEELSWQLPYGRQTEAILLKPAGIKDPLPGILAFHDHGGNKYFGTRKITRTNDNQHPLMTEHQKEYYSGRAWANEVARRGYVVLVSDAFPFASRRVMLQDVPEHLRGNLNDDNPEDRKNIEAYNEWARNHEDVMAKSLFSAGTTWPGVFFAEDRIALDILCSREDVISDRIGCGGLSGGGMRTVFMGGLDQRIKCAVCVGFMTTWKDFVINKSFTHTWMTYVPVLPNELDFPEILGLRVPLATMVLNDSEDELYTLTEMNRADRILQEVYNKADAADRYRCSYYPGIHKFDSSMQAEAFDWFDKWLKK
ncbi:MAG: alpha/beta hydrolase family protein [Bacteroidales bacterium]|nr:alpha/beta hydrolase family protein [Bacteroidales bacterium]